MEYLQRREEEETDREASEEATTIGELSWWRSVGRRMEKKGTPLISISGLK